MTPWLVATFTVILAWSVLAVGFHRHVESGPGHDCQVCTATHAPATSVELASLPASPLLPLDRVLAHADRTPPALALLFVSNRAPPLS
jgi:hypothetical protein